LTLDEHNASLTRRAADWEGMMGRIFISHSSLSDPDAELVRDTVQSQLEERGHTVLLDKERLEPGDEWRSVLYQWLGECDGAIVLLNEQAVASPWVAREATILLWRRALGSPVRIVPVLLGGLRFESGEDSWFRELAALQAARIDAPGTGQTEAQLLAERAVARIGDVSELPAADIPLGAWLRDVAECLADVSPDRLAQAARRLNVRDEDWQRALLPGAEMFLAHQLLVRPLDVEVVEAIADLARGMTDERLRRLVDLIRPTWVDAEAARQLVSASRPGDPDAANAGLAPESAERPGPGAWLFGINAGLPGTLQTYIERATCCSNYGYRARPVSGVYGEAATEELLAQSETAIRAALNVRGNRPIDERDFDAPRVKRAFLLFDPDVADPVKLADVARTLHNRYPRLTLIMATGSQLPSSDLLAAWRLPEIRLIEPQLSGDAERDGDQLGADLADLPGAR
jgi:hypothetical protein